MVVFGISMKAKSVRFDACRYQTKGIGFPSFGATSREIRKTSTLYDIGDGKCLSYGSARLEMNARSQSGLRASWCLIKVLINHVLKVPQKSPRLLRYPANLVRRLAVELEIAFGLRGSRRTRRAAPSSVRGRKGAWRARPGPGRLTSISHFCYISKMSWTVSFVNAIAEAEVAALPADMRSRFAQIGLLIGERGVMAVHEPYVKHLTGKLWEMRLKGRDGIARSIYVAASSQRIVVLRTFVKKTQKTPRHEIEIALARMKEIDR
jgi:phage-related protein